MPRIEINYVVETHLAQERHIDAQVEPVGGFELVDESIFAQRFVQYKLGTELQGRAAWNRIMGNYSQVTAGAVNHPQLHYLTEESSEAILKNYTLFVSGIDIKHLPAGFFMVRKSDQTGLREVLHFSDFVAQNNQPSPLAISLGDKSQDEPAATNITFPEPQNTWYQFLLEKARSGKAPYCSSKELYEAFVHFSNRLRGLDLTFYEPDFSLIGQEDIHPIVLLGRWDTILHNPCLKKEDREIQWQSVLKLDLRHAYGAIRCLTDYEQSAQPCGFLLPEMRCDEVTDYGRYTGVRTALQVSDITRRSSDDGSFWRYLAFQPARQSIGFYREALAEINKITFHQNNRTLGDRLLPMLAGGTTRYNYRATMLPAVQAAEALLVWKKVCQLVSKIENKVGLIVSAAGGAGTLQADFVTHLARISPEPNMPFLNDIAEYISQDLERLSLISATVSVVKGESPVKSLEELSNKLSSVLFYVESQLYAGSRFYFIDGKWQQLGTKAYIELQYFFKQKSPALFTVVAGVLSTFSIKTEADIMALLEVYQPGSSAMTPLVDDYPLAVSEALQFCMTIFADANCALTTSDLSAILTRCKRFPCGEKLNRIEILNYIEQDYARAFPNNYFDEKKSEILNAEYGLSPQQYQLLDNYAFTAAMKTELIKIESSLLRKAGYVSPDVLTKLNDQWFILSEILEPDEFLQFLSRISHIHEYLGADFGVLSRLIEALIKEKSLSSFNVIYLRNRLSGCKDDTLLSKITMFVEEVSFIHQSPWQMNPVILQELFASFLLSKQPEYIDCQAFIEQAKGLVFAVHDTIMQQPQVHDDVLQAIQAYSRNIADDQSYIGLVIDYQRMVKTIFSECNSQTLCHSVIAHFKDKPWELAKLFRDFSLLEFGDRMNFYQLAVGYLDSGQSLDKMAELVELCLDKPSVMSSVLSMIPPYPSLDLLLEWDKSDNLAIELPLFQKQPFGERISEHCFNVAHYREQRQRFSGVDPVLFSDELGNELAETLANNRQKGWDALFEEFDQLFVDEIAPLLEQNKPLAPKQQHQLLCFCIEVLARTSFQLDGSETPQKSSVELNTTQVMALLAMIKNPKSKVINQIDTGEGKSRIMMVLAAYQALTKHTVDVVTSDLALAERDYFNFKQFFNVLGLQTSLISLHTPPSLYQKKGINFTDMAQLQLLRNRSDIDGKPFAYLDEAEESRCALIDEVDKFIHDKSRDAFNYASKSNRLSGYLWIYPILTDFMEDYREHNPGYLGTDCEALVGKFLDFLSAHDSNLAHQASAARLQTHAPKQLITWLKAAFIAHTLEVDKDYKVTPDRDDLLVTVRDHEGISRHTRQVLVLENGRPLPGSSFSDGVHQCLCAIENKKAGKEAFVILAETETQRCSYVETYLAKYPHIYGVSGTTRWQAPQADSSINHQDYGYLVTPRERQLVRVDKPTRVAKDFEQQLAFVKAELLDAMRAQRAFLLVCRDDSQSARIYQALLQDTLFNKSIKKLQHVHGLTELADEKSAIKAAGIPGTVTIASVGMFARGVDIRSEYLSVRATFIPSHEDNIQIQGRTGRFGRPGDYRLILNTQDEAIVGRSYDHESQVQTQQQKMALQAAFEEEVSSIYAEFLETVHQAFLTAFVKAEPFEQANLLQKWQDYLDNLQKDWDLQRGHLIQLGKQDDKTEFTAAFSAFTDRWIAAFDMANKPSYRSEKPDVIFNSLKAQQRFFQPKRQALTVKHQYDPSDDGQARIYDRPFVQLGAVLRGERHPFADIIAWREGRGALFPDLQATLRGERPLFATLRLIIQRLVAYFSALFQHKPVETSVTNGENDLAREEAVGSGMSTTAMV